MIFSFSSPPLFSSLFFASLFSPSPLSSLVLSLLFSCLLLLFSFFFFFFSLSSSLFSLCLLSPCVGGVCVVVWWCGVVWHAENPCVDTKTPPCVDSKRPRVCRQHAHMLKNTRVVVASSVYQKITHVEFSLGHREVHHRNPSILHIFKFEKRSRTTCSRFLPSFALPDEAVKLQLSWGNIGRTSREMVRFVFRSHEKKYNERFAR